MWYGFAILPEFIFTDIDLIAPINRVATGFNFDIFLRTVLTENA